MVDDVMAGGGNLNLVRVGGHTETLNTCGLDVDAAE
jgi:hypothetical protein